MPITGGVHLLFSGMAKQMLFVVPNKLPSGLAQIRRLKKCPFSSMIRLPAMSACVSRERAFIQATADPSIRWARRAGFMENPVENISGRTMRSTPA
jgi:hypothetical protein